MRILRPFVWAAVLVAGFLYVTSVAQWDVGRLLNPVRNSSRAWTEPASAATAGVYTPDEQNNIDIYRVAKEATVNITSVVVHEDYLFGGAYQGQGAGSGFIINPDGRILTNFHVVGGSAQLTVTLNDKKTYKARILGVDRRNDLALIKIDAARKLPALPLGDSDKIVVGQKAIAIGNPFGQFGGTLTVGVVSALDRSIKTEGQPLEGMVQTDAAINPGNSGGPLLDSHGNVIAINTAIYGPQGNIGLGFAMPINRAKGMLDEFTRTGRITAPYLGVSTLPISAEIARALDLPGQPGLLVQRVDPASPAAEYGIKGPTRRVIVGNYPINIGGDFIVAIDGKAIEEETNSLASVMGKKRGGDPMELTVIRNGRKETVKVKLGSREQM